MFAEGLEIRSITREIWREISGEKTFFPEPKVGILRDCLEEGREQRLSRTREVRSQGGERDPGKFCTAQGSGRACKASINGRRRRACLGDLRNQGTKHKGIYHEFVRSRRQAQEKEDFGI